MAKRPRKKDPPPTVTLLLGDKALRPAQARNLLGWRAAAKGETPLLKDLEGQPVVCELNPRNRPLYMAKVAELQQEILFGRWRFNGEPLIVGCQGNVLNGQHTLIALVLAEQAQRLRPEDYSAWRGEPCIDKALVAGVSEDDAVVNTMDTCKPRTLADVVYRSAYWAKDKPKHRRAISRATDHAIRLLWRRTGAGLHALAPRRTHSEALDFLERHPKLLECVRYCWEEDGGKERRIARYLSLGYASAMLYLMACSGSPPADYYAGRQCEDQLQFDHWDRACDFWTWLAGDEPRLKPLTTAYAELLSNRPGTVDERCALLAKAWLRIVRGKTLRAADLKLEYARNDFGIDTLAERPSLGGIDLVENSSLEDEAGSATVKRRAVKQRTHNNGLRVGRRTDPDLWQSGDTAWVCEPHEEAYFACLTGAPYQAADGERVLVEGDGGQWEVKTEWLQLEASKAS